MVNINDGTIGKEDLQEALKGDYGTFTMRNGVVVTKQGRIVNIWGAFGGGAEVVEIPSLPARFPVSFAGDDFSCATIAEVNSGFVKVPSIAAGKRFVIFGTCLLNN